MTKPRGYTDTDMTEVSDHPEWTEAEFAESRPFAEVFPDLAEGLRQHGPRLSPTKQRVSLELDAEVMDRFRAGGPGWQTRINAALRKAVGLADEG